MHYTFIIRIRARVLSTGDKCDDDKKKQMKKNEEKKNKFSPCPSAVNICTNANEYAIQIECENCLISKTFNSQIICINWSVINSINAIVRCRFFIWYLSFNVKSIFFGFSIDFTLCACESDKKASATLFYDLIWKPRRILNCFHYRIKILFSTNLIFFALQIILAGVVLCLMTGAMGAEKEEKKAVVEAEKKSSDTAVEGGAEKKQEKRGIYGDFGYGHGHGWEEDHHHVHHHHEKTIYSVKKVPVPYPVEKEVSIQ